MDDLTLDIVDDGLDNLIETIYAGFDAIPLPPGVAPYRSEPLGIALKGDDGRIEGGVVGHTAWGWLYVNYLWVSETCRGGGQGGRLLAMAEREAEKRGCHGVWLHTISFQAPAFYERMGYERFGELSDLPNGHQRIFYRKRLSPAPG